MDSYLIFQYRSNNTEDLNDPNYGLTLSTSDQIEVNNDFDRVIFHSHHIPEFVESRSTYKGLGNRIVNIGVEYTYIHNTAYWLELKRSINKYFSASMVGIQINFVENNRNHEVKMNWLDPDDTESIYLHGLYNSETNVISVEPPLSGVFFHAVITHEILHYCGLDSHRTHPECSLNLMHENISTDHIYLTPLQIMTLHGISDVDFLPDFDTFPILNFI